MNIYLCGIGLRVPRSRVDTGTIHCRMLLLLLLLRRPAMSVRSAEVSLRLAVGVELVRVLLVLVQRHVLLLLLQVLLVQVLLLGLLLALHFLLLFLQKKLLLLF